MIAIVRPLETQLVEWLARPLVCDGAVVAEPLDPVRLTDADLLAICLRMHAIFHTVEMPRAEERWMPVQLFDAIDTLESVVLHNDPRPPKLAEWAGVIREFGTHYRLAGRGPIAVDPIIYREVATRYNQTQQAEPTAVPDRGGD